MKQFSYAEYIIKPLWLSLQVARYRIGRTSKENDIQREIT